jgi:L-ascorbate metabolism protein UlaG (beta-lactamase superfamily)
MVINWYGEGCFKVQTGGLTILSDPFDASTGLTPPRFKADLVLKTLVSYPVPYQGTREETVTLEGAGEYEVKGIEVWGSHIEPSARELKTVYLVKTEELSLGFLGHIAKLPSLEIIEALGNVDILFIPANGTPYLEPEPAAKLIKQLAPKIVVTSFIKVPGLKRKAGDAKDFLTELGLKADPQEKLTIKKKELPGSTHAVVLTL